MNATGPRKVFCNVGDVDEGAFVVDDGFQKLLGDVGGDEEGATVDTGGPPSANGNDAAGDTVALAAGCRASMGPA